MCNLYVNRERDYNPGLKKHRDLAMLSVDE